MDEQHLLAPIRYIELNAVPAGFCNTPPGWPWPSARADLNRRDDILIKASRMHARVDNWASHLTAQSDADVPESIRRHTRTGRPLGSDAFIEKLEDATGRRLKKRERGGPPNQLYRPKEIPK